MPIVTAWKNARARLSRLDTCFVFNVCINHVMSMETTYAPVLDMLLMCPKQDFLVTIFFDFGV